jgi:DNA invertase Pin-like site-specific DNA recombinase
MLGAFGWRQLASVNRKIYSPTIIKTSVLHSSTSVRRQESLFFHVFSALAEFKRNLIRERTLAGLKAARARGRQGGRPRKLQPKEQKTIRALLKTTEVSVPEIATRFGVSR